MFALTVLKIFDGRTGTLVSCPPLQMTLPHPWQFNNDLDGGTNCDVGIWILRCTTVPNMRGKHKDYFKFTEALSNEYGTRDNQTIKNEGCAENEQRRHTPAILDSSS
jgi:hypothetical protein